MFVRRGDNELSNWQECAFADLLKILYLVFDGPE